MFLELSKKILLISIIIISFSFSNLYAQKGGFVDKISVAQGDILTFYISSSVPKFVLKFYKLENTQIFKTESDSVSGIVQSVSSTAYVDGVNWSPTLQFQIPLNWETGIYRAQYPITSNPDIIAAIIFIVKEDNPGSFSKTLYILSTNTWNAYNNFGGKSIYEFNSTDNVRSFKVSFHRPFARDLGIFGAPDYYVYANKLINWATNNNILLEMASMYDLDANPNLLDNYDILFLAGHNEYWSMDERIQVENFV
ncbi:MAG: hypothetical protein COW08_00195, partial [Ignavibacteriales bacterium CG12_big_fil_rev_8_21_14_0_65_30_8]